MGAGGVATYADVANWRQVGGFAVALLPRAVGTVLAACAFLCWEPDTDGATVARCGVLSDRGVNLVNPAAVWQCAMMWCEWICAFGLCPARQGGSGWGDNRVACGLCFACRAVCGDLKCKSSMQGMRLQTHCCVYTQNFLPAHRSTQALTHVPLAACVEVHDVCAYAHYEYMFRSVQVLLELLSAVKMKTLSQNADSLARQRICPHTHYCESFLFY